MKKQTLKSKLISYVGFLTLSVATFSILYVLINEYLNYEVINEIHTHRPSEIVFPDISLCGQTTRFINYTIFGQLFPAYGNEINRLGNVTNQEQFIKWTSTSTQGRDYFKSNVLYNLTVQQLLQSSYNGSTFIHNLQITYRNSFLFMEKTVTENLCKKTLFIKGLSTCIGIHCSRRKAYILKRSNILQTDGIMARVFLNSEAAISVSSLNIYLHKPNTFPRGFDAPYTTISIPATKAGREYIIDFSQIKNRLLPAPYVTQCHDYLRDGFESQIHKQENCYNHFSVALVKRFFRHTIEHSNTNYLLASSYYFDMYQDKKKQKTYKWVMANCSSIAIGADCESELYMPEVRRDVEYRDGKYKIQFNLPTGSILMNLCVPKNRFTQFALMIGNVLSLAFGLNAINAFQRGKKWLLIMIKYLYLNVQHWWQVFNYVFLNSPKKVSPIKRQSIFKTIKKASPIVKRKNVKHKKKALLGEV